MHQSTFVTQAPLNVSHEWENFLPVSLAVNTEQPCMIVLTAFSVYTKQMTAAVPQTTNPTCQLDVAPFEGSKTAHVSPWC